MKFRIRPLVAALALAALAGCTSFPKDYQMAEVDSQGDVITQYQDNWSAIPAIRYVQSTAGASVSKYFTLPQKIAQRQVDINLDARAKLTVGELTDVLRTQGYRVVSQLTDSAQNPLLLHRYKGSMEDFMQMLAATQNVAYEYRSGVIFLVEASRFSASLPKSKELLEQVAKSVADMGGQSVHTDMLAGMVYYSAKPNISDYIAEYLDRISQNSAMVTLQIAVVTVSLNRDADRGFDWGSVLANNGAGTPTSMLSNGVAGAGMNQMQSGYPGYGGYPSAGGYPGYPGAGGYPNYGNGSVGGAFGSAVGSAVGDAAAKVAKGSVFSFTGGTGLGYMFNSQNFSLTAAIKALSTFGTARTEQNVVLGTVSGMPVKMESGDEIPYVKEIGAAGVYGSGLMGSSSTDVKKTGLKLSVLPNFDAADNSVMADIGVEMSTLVGYIQLNAGNALGTQSQPQMRNLKFSNLGRLRVGGTLIVGGITYNQVSDTYNGLPGVEELPIGSKVSKTEKSSVYIVVRPTVVIFSPDAKRLNAEIAAAEKAGKPSPSALEARRQAQSIIQEAPASIVQAVSAPEVRELTSSAIKAPEVE